MAEHPTIQCPLSSPWTNPFSTSQIRPGAIEYNFPPGYSEERFWQRFQILGRCGQIIGPHGSGKSTLIRWLVPRLARRGLDVRLIPICSDERQPAVDASVISNWGRNIQVIVDGYEQLSWRWRALLRWQSRRRQCGLVVSAHCDAGLATLYRTCVTPDLANAVVGRLLSKHPNRELILRSLCRETGQPGQQILSRQAVEALLSRHNGDLRETLFSLYDLCEKLRPQSK
jgi:hypothetical protein